MQGGSAGAPGGAGLGQEWSLGKEGTGLPSGLMSGVSKPKHQAPASLSPPMTRESWLHKLTALLLPPGLWNSH